MFIFFIIGSPRTYPCRAIASNIITIHNPLITEDIFKVEIRTIKNPSTTYFPYPRSNISTYSMDDWTYTYKYKLSDGTVLSQASMPAYYHVPGTLKYCQMTFKPSLVN